MRCWLKRNLVCRFLHNWYTSPVYGSRTREHCWACLDWDAIEENY